MAGIEAAGPSIGHERDVEHDRLAERALEKGLEGADDLVDVDDQLAHRVAPGEGQ